MKKPPDFWQNTTNQFFSDSIVPFDKRAWQNPVFGMWPDNPPKNFRITKECEMCGILTQFFISGEVWEICDKCLAEYTHEEITAVRKKKAEIKALKKHHGNNL
jgi:hypothetical protein